MNKRHVVMMAAAVLGACLLTGCTTVRVPAGGKVPGDKYYTSKTKGRITSVTIGEGAEIGRRAFADNQLTSLTIGEGVTIGDDAFQNNQLTSLTVPEGVKIGDWAFERNQLTSLTISEGVKIGDSAFGRNQLTSLTISEGVTIGRGAFENNQISSLTIGEGVTIGFGAFAHNQLSSLTIGEDVTIGWAAFNDNPLTRIVFEGAVADCWVSAFGADNAEVGVAVINGRTPGTYTKEGDTWLFNGVPLPRLARLGMGYGIHVVTIDGAEPDQKKSEVLQGRGYRMWVVPAGWHTVEVKYDTRGGGSYGTWSQGSVTFEHRYLFEGGEYYFTGEVEGDQIVFRIVPK
jgi:serine acetyltransferase